ncbi:DNA replication/repair protein RecF [Gleimia sp. 6138-11-ORH1]|uniref:DNA replication/repair protein RecF n=1 Tax=Gleimia sp. 6138-11-ORH1 TaxID=2973937 RepID=UPI002168D0DC|nr:DNA replication/repair protein RecF [Gleimia sp. 6138-11-ORH1]MCS4485127.1 DNA replication/repair protein RecF [Gleimia sp. 6138-11-ORH1]
MYVSHLALNDFRSYRETLIEFKPGITILLGYNGQGKTNVIEAIAYLAHLSSHRVNADNALVRYPQPSEASPSAAVIRAKINRAERERILEIEIVKGRANRARLNRVAVKPRDLVGEIKVVVFAPEDLNLVKGDPATRRHFLDSVATQMWPAYAAFKADYERVLKQRASLLKQLGKMQRSGQKVDFSMLEIWDEQLVTLARQLVALRMKLIAVITTPTQNAHETVARGVKKLQLEYANSILEAFREVPLEISEYKSLNELASKEPDLYEKIMREALVKQRSNEVNRGVNLVGPHRDDLLLWLDDLPVKGFASHGESWSVALALRLGCFEILTKEEYGKVETPVLILDDVFSELDGNRRRALLEAIKPAKQVIITAAVETDVPAEIEAEVLSVTFSKETGSVCEAGKEDA